MARKSFIRLFGSLLGLILVVPVMAQTSKVEDREMERVQGMIATAKKEVEGFSKAGGKADDPKHPNLKWAATFWSYRLKHLGTPAATAATTQALQMLYRSERLSEMQSKADTLKLDEPAWRQLIFLVLSAAIKTKDYAYFFSKAEALTQSAADPNIKALARLKIGEAYWRKGDLDQTRTAFLAVVSQYPKTAYAEDARGNLREIEFLNVGQTAPQFEHKTIDGAPLSLDGFKGKIVVLKFWATYCAQCVEETPQLKELNTQYKDHDMVVVGISLDEDPKLVREMVTNKGMDWLQLLDADATISKLYNVTGTPTYYLIDREGKIAAKNLPSFKRLSTAIDSLIKKP
jgi:peroxiredoxin